MEYVINVLVSCLGQYEEIAIELVIMVHNIGVGQAIAGDKEALEELAEHIENDARKKKHPLKLQVVKV